MEVGLAGIEAVDECCSGSGRPPSFSFSSTADPATSSISLLPGRCFWRLFPPSHRSAWLRDAIYRAIVIRRAEPPFSVLASGPMQLRGLVRRPIQCDIVLGRGVHRADFSGVGCAAPMRMTETATAHRVGSRLPLIAFSCRLAATLTFGVFHPQTAVPCAPFRKPNLG